MLFTQRILHGVDDAKKALFFQQLLHYRLSEKKSACP
jgi:hypothetical protein